MKLKRFIPFLLILGLVIACQELELKPNAQVDNHVKAKNSAEEANFFYAQLLVTRDAENLSEEQKKFFKDNSDNNAIYMTGNGVHFGVVNNDPCLPHFIVFPNHSNPYVKEVATQIIENVNWDTFEKEPSEIMKSIEAKFEENGFPVQVKNLPLLNNNEKGKSESMIELLQNDEWLSLTFADRTSIENIKEQIVSSSVFFRNGDDILDSNASLLIKQNPESVGVVLYKFPKSYFWSTIKSYPFDKRWNAAIKNKIDDFIIFDLLVGNVLTSERAYLNECKEQLLSIGCVKLTQEQEEKKRKLIEQIENQLTKKIEQIILTSFSQMNTPPKVSVKIIQDENEDGSCNYSFKVTFSGENPLGDCDGGSLSSWITTTYNAFFGK